MHPLSVSYKNSTAQSREDIVKQSYDAVRISVVSKNGVYSNTGKSDEPELLSTGATGATKDYGEFS